jgi:hypothetical protein
MRITTLLCIVLASAMLQAQTMSGGMSGGMNGGMSGGARGASPAGNGHGMRPGNGLVGPRVRHHQVPGNGGLWLPYEYWGDDWEDSGSDYAENQPADDGSQEPVPASRPVVMASRQPITPPAQSPKLVEIPLPKDAAATPQAPTLFVLTNGERLESQNYVLTSDWLRVEIGRKQVTIPISSLDLPATIAANRERGIEMNVPRDHSSVYLSF